MEWHQNEWMTLEWPLIDGMTPGWHQNKSQMMVSLIPSLLCYSKTIEWVSNDEIWFEWGPNDEEKKLGHLPCFKNFIIPPSFKSLTIIPGWENYHSSIISFILRSFSIWTTIEWQRRHFTMTQNDRDEQGIKLVKISPSKISLIPTSFLSFFSLRGGQLSQLAYIQNLYFDFVILISFHSHSVPLGGARCHNLHIYKFAFWLCHFISFLFH